MEDIKKGDILLDMYRVIEELGEGEFGKVYRVEGLKGKYKWKEFALKIARDEYAVEYLWKEVQSLILLRHPNIISLISYLYKKEEKKLYVIYELMDSGNLKDYLKNKDLSILEIKRIFEDITNGLAFLHHMGYIHSDIKPDNIFGKKILKGLIWKLGDFGLLKTKSGQSLISVKGTVGYIAPEIFKNEIYQSSDLFSMGCLLHYLFTKKDPFDINSEKPKLKLNKACEYEISYNIPSKIRDFIKMLLSCDYTKRFKNAIELKEYIKTHEVFNENNL